MLDKRAASLQRLRVGAALLAGAIAIALLLNGTGEEQARVLARVRGSGLHKHSDGWVSRPPSRNELYSELRVELPLRPVAMVIGIWEDENVKAILRELRPRLLIIAGMWLEKKDGSEGVEREKFGTEIDAGVVRVGKGASKPQIDSMQDGEVDMLFLNMTTHAYDVVKAEFDGAVRVISRGGVLCGTGFVHRDKSEVIAAVVEFALHYNWSVTHISRVKEESRYFCMQRVLA